MTTNNPTSPREELARIMARLQSALDVTPSERWSCSNCEQAAHDIIAIVKGHVHD